MKRPVPGSVSPLSARRRSCRGSRLRFPAGVSGVARRLRQSAVPGARRDSHVATAATARARRAVDAPAPRPQSAPDDRRYAHVAAALPSPPMLLIMSILCGFAVCAHARHEQRDRGRSLHGVGTTVPSRISRTIGFFGDERAFQRPGLPFVLRQTRLTTSLPTGPQHRASTQRRTRRVLVPAR